MIVVLDANMLVYFFDEKSNPPLSKSTGQPVARCKERLDHLIATLAQDKAKIIVPTPALAEVLVYAQQGAPERLNIIKTSKHFRVVPFDERAAVEFAATQANGRGSAARAKAKFDDQIIAIAAVEQAEVIYSDDADIAKRAGSRFRVIGIEALPLPPEDAQQDMFKDIRAAPEPGDDEET